MERCQLIGQGVKDGKVVWERWSMCHTRVELKRLFFVRWRLIDGCPHYSGPSFKWGWGDYGR